MKFDTSDFGKELHRDIVATKNTFGKTAKVSSNNYKEIEEDLIITLFKQEMRRWFDGLKTTILVTDGVWQVPVEQRFKGWEKLTEILEKEGGYGTDTGNLDTTSQTTDENIKI